MENHLNKVYVNAFTSKADDWIVKLIFETPSRQEALYLEKFVKKMKSKKFIERMIETPTILKNILERK